MIGLLVLAAVAADPAATQIVPLPVAHFKKIDRDSGKDNYFQVVTEAGDDLIAADYKPGQESETYGTDLPEALRQKVLEVRWRWRGRTFPTGGDDCAHGVADSAAGVFLTFHSGLKWTLLKYIWSEKRPVGDLCDKRNSPFLRRQTTVLESGGPLGTWHSEALDPKGEFVKHFGGKREDVPDFVGIGLLTDGDQTKTSSAADYGDFSVAVRTP